jgi:hypothetical protein
VALRHRDWPAAAELSGLPHHSQKAASGDSRPQEGQRI